MSSPLHCVEGKSGEASVQNTNRKSNFANQTQPPAFCRSDDQRPDLQNILRQSYDCLTTTSKLRSTWDWRLYIGDIHNSVLSHVYDTYKTMEMTRSHHGWVHMFSTHRPTVILQLLHFDLFRTCRTSSFSTVVWQLARLQLTRRIARSLGDSGASCFIQVACLIINLLLLFM